jgi:hypothetical protein
MGRTKIREIQAEVPTVDVGATTPEDLDRLALDARVVHDRWVTRAYSGLGELTVPSPVDPSEQA